MARIFSISFDHNGLEQSAIVSVHVTPLITEYTLGMMDEDILAYLPSTRILSDNQYHFVFAEHGQQPMNSVMKEIVKAVAEHVRTGTVV